MSGHRRRVSYYRALHDRTVGAINLTGCEKYQDKIAPNRQFAMLDHRSIEGKPVLHWVGETWGDSSMTKDKAAT
jgi:hypothetical protein